MAFAGFRTSGNSCPVGAAAGFTKPVGTMKLFLVECTYLSRSPDFRNESTKEAGWRDSSNAPQWVTTALRRNVSSSEASRDRFKDFSSISREYRTGTTVDCNSPQADDFSWTALIVQHTKSGQGRQALRTYKEMLESGVKPSSYTFVAALKACSSLQDLETAKQIHAAVVINKFESVAQVGNMLVDVYAKCASLADARCVFEKMLHRDVVSWTTMIFGYAQMGEGEEALQLYTRMQEQGVVPNDRTYVGALKACSTLIALERGKEGDGKWVKQCCLQHVRAIHSDAVKSGSELGIYVGTMLVDVYAKSECLVDSRRVFEKMPYRTVVSWNAMILGYAQMEESQEALQLYARMKLEGVLPNDQTFGGALKACSSLVAFEVGTEADGKIVKQRGLEQVGTIHSDVVKSGSNSAIFVWNILVGLYAKCGSLVSARQVFEEMPHRNVISWNTILWVYAQLGESEEALELYARMLQEGVLPDDRTFVGALKACSGLAGIEEWNKGDGKCLKTRCLENVRAIHSDIVRSGSQLSVFVGTMLVDAYAKCGSLVDARHVFAKMPHRDAVSWTAMISGYAQMEEGEEALALYSQMQKEGVPPNHLTFLGALKACSVVAGLEKGKEIHAQFSKIGLEDAGVLVPTSLIDMYSKCGSMKNAQQVFDALQTRAIATWNALISGYAHHGDSESVFELFQRMKQDGTQPDSITFLSLLNVCSHVGLVDKGQKYFEAMDRDYGIAPTIDHYTCVIDLLGRAGEVDNAMCIVQNMPFQPDGVVWQAVLCACQKWSDVELGRKAFESAVSSDEMDAAAYVLMSNVYAAANMLEDAEKIQVRRVKARAWKKPGQSLWTDINGTVHAFVVGGREHRESTHIYAKLEDMFVKMKQQEYLPHFFPDISDNGNEDLWCRN